MHWFFNGLLAVALGAIGAVVILLLSYFGCWLIERSVDRETKWRE